jgi:hypothetical protein
MAMPAHKQDGIDWRKSSHSGSGDCVEVRWEESDPSGVAVRGSKQLSGPTLAFPTTTWRTFLHNNGKVDQ